MRRVMAVICGSVGNALLSYLADRLGMPVYLDTIGTIVVAALGGIFPGVMTAVLTNCICLIYNTDSMYYVLIQALVAIITVWFFKKEDYKNPQNLIRFFLVIASVGALLSALIQWGLLGGPQNKAIADSVTGLQEFTGIPTIILFFVIMLLLNLFDKGISILASLVIIHFIPKDIRTSIMNSGWKQRPLSKQEIGEIDNWGKGVAHSARIRITFMLAGISLALILVVSGIGFALYFNSQKIDYTNSAYQAADLASHFIDPEMVNKYLIMVSKVPGYNETLEDLKSINENFPFVESIYVMRIQKDGCYYIFDVDPVHNDPYPPGKRTEIDNSLKPYIGQLLKGEDIEPIECNDMTGWVISVYRPLKDSRGNTVCYVAVDVSMKYLTLDSGRFILKIMLIISGFFILILAIGMWITGFYTVYPINSLATCIDNFIEAGDDQGALDEHVKNLRRLDIHTDDETEKLYHSICQMAMGMAEQMRDIRHYTDSTAKMQNGLIITMANMVENRDSDTGAHIQKTAAYVRIILDGLKEKGYYSEKLTPKYMSDVELSAPLHDVGKINIPDAVLNKPGKLTDEEFEIMKTHTTAGKHIMESAISTVQGENYLKEARNMAAYHHERWDGKGYPEKLHGEVIPLSARIMAVADVFDALTSARVYKPPFPLEKALEIISDGSGTQFDPKCVEVFMDSLTEVKKVLRKYNNADV
ncbi:MAG: HD domain-containing protein [Lachnospiraceae bacterium]|nr:HD domain-containing protein [Lachnospiraceae bacterium]